jgi:hypothetical protein
MHGVSSIASAIAEFFFFDNVHIPGNGTESLGPQIRFRFDYYYDFVKTIIVKQQGVNFINVLRATFMRADPKSAKNFGDLRA